MDKNIEAKNEKPNNVIIESYKYSYNERRYSLPWVCLMTRDGKYDFSVRIGCYSGNDGEAGDLVVFRPIVGRVYAYGQKDYYGKSEIKYAKWDGKNFVPCNKLGKEKQLAI